METIDNIVNKLSKEERELHKDLIRECREREEDIRQISKKVEDNVYKLNETLDNLIKEIEVVYKASLKLEKVHQEALCKISAASLNMIPDEMFFQA